MTSPIGGPAFERQQRIREISRYCNITEQEAELIYVRKEMEKMKWNKPLNKLKRAVKNILRLD